jgi:zona occludens toxin
MVQLLLINIEPAEQDSEAGEVQRCINQMCDQTPDNALIVWDEIQDYFPSGNMKLPLNQQKFWTEHRHRGLDIIIMGQDRTDVHKLIRNRIRTVIYFLKQEAIGRPDHYKWEIYQKQKLGKFEKTGSGTREYEAKYFGTYMSHRREGTRSKVYTTARTNMLANTKGLTLGIPLAFAAAIYAVYHLYGFFHPEAPATTAAVKVERVEEAEPIKPTRLVNPAPDELAATAPAAAPQTGTAKPEQREAIDYLDKLAQQHQLRAMGYMWSDKPGKELMGYVEFLDPSFHQKEKLMLSEVIALGWTVTRKDYGLLLEKQGLAYVARAWPIDVYGRVDQKTVDSLGSSSPQGRTNQTGQTTGTRVTVVEDTSRTPRTL